MNNDDTRRLILCDAKLRKCIEEKKQQSRMAPLCEKHSVGTGTRSGCPYCGIQVKDQALSKIDYMLGPPNEMECSLYDIDYSEQRVVNSVAQFIAKYTQLERQ